MTEKERHAVLRHNRRQLVINKLIWKKRALRAWFRGFTSNSTCHSLGGL